MRPVSLPMRVLLALLMLCLAGCRGDRSTNACPAAACAYSGLELLLDSPLPAEALAGAELEYCLNGECARAVFAHGGAPTGAPLQRPGLVQAVGNVTVITRGKHSTWLSLQPPFASGQMQDGDMYRVKLTDRAGHTLLRHDERVHSYGIFHPNGPDCPPECKQARSDRRSHSP